MKKEKESNPKTWFLVVGGVIVTYFIFLFDYKKDHFTWIHSIIAIAGLFMIVLNIKEQE